MEGAGVGGVARAARRRGVGPEWGSGGMVGEVGEGEAEVRRAGARAEREVGRGLEVGESEIRRSGVGLFEKCGRQLERRRREGVWRRVNDVLLTSSILRLFYSQRQLQLPPTPH